VNAVPETLAVVVVCVPPPHADNRPDTLANRKLLAVPSGRESVVSLNTGPGRPRLGGVVSNSGVW
jgi:hypothetical protein